MKKYRCTVCEWIYDPAVGDPDGGIAAGTAFEDIPEDWVCPLCGVGKDQFEPVEEYALPCQKKTKRCKPVGLLRSSFTMLRRLGGRYDIDDEYPERFGNIAEFS